MRLQQTLLFAGALVAVPLSAVTAADVTFKYISASDAARLVTADSSKKLYDIANTDAFRMALQIRNSSGRAEKHLDWNEEIVVQEGDVLLNYGGTGSDIAEIAPGEFRGDSIIGGSSILMHAGDIVTIPANSWHQMVIQTKMTRDILFRTKK